MKKGIMLSNGLRVKYSKRLNVYRLYSGNANCFLNSVVHDFKTQSDAECVGNMIMRQKGYCLSVDKETELTAFELSGAKRY